MVVGDTYTYDGHCIMYRLAKLLGYIPEIGIASCVNYTQFFTVVLPVISAMNKSTNRKFSIVQC